MKKNYNLFQKWCLRKAQIKFDRIYGYFAKQDAILDIGCGNGALAYLLKNKAFNITAVDIKNNSSFPNKIKPIIYDGQTLPFEDNSFDKVQLITVLHHIEDPENTIQEAARVGKEIIIIEEVYHSTFQKYLTFVADSINNWEFVGHPHTNKTDQEWKQVFKQENLELVEAKYNSFLLFFSQATYHLKCP